MSQGVLGAIAVQAVARPREMRVASAVGFVAGMLADLDVLIRDARDPLLTLEFHRQFSHSLVFVPVAATLIALGLWPVLGWLRRTSGLAELGLGRLWCWAAIAYGTHGLLDACTTYGTSLLWPFDDLRVAWHLVAVIDPGLTVPAVVLAGLAARRRAPRLGRIALAWVVAWLALGLVQRERADALLEELAAHHGLVIERGGAKPTLFNLLLWRGVWQSGDTLYAVALRPGWWGPGKVSRIATTPAFSAARELPGLDRESTAAGDLARFRHFSDGWLVAMDGDSENGRLIGDFRYAMLPHEIRPLWAIRVFPKAPERHADWVPMRTVPAGTLPRFFEMVRGAGGLAPIGDATSPEPTVNEAPPRGDPK